MRCSGVTFPHPSFILTRSELLRESPLDGVGSIIIGHAACGVSPPLLGLHELLGPGPSARRADSASRSRGGDRRRPLRLGVGPCRAADRFLAVFPNDGVPAADSTQVLVWYSATAIYFGIRAFEQHGRPTVTLASRDQIFGDDNVQILLGTFHDAKQVLMFAVNPLGVQGDGSLVEGANVTAGGFIGSAVVGREQPDLSPDFVFQSHGRVTHWGYEVEVRIPFKSIRYQPQQPQDWRLNIVREVKHSGFEDSWFPARRASATFIGQSGNLVLKAGVLDF